MEGSPSSISRKMSYSSDASASQQDFSFLYDDDVSNDSLFDGLEDDTNNLEDYVPIEDDFGSGTAANHFEEGLDNNYSTEYRYINGVYYPVITNEICTGFVDTSNYLTSLTVGLLEDLGFTVNYNSSYIKNTGNNISILTEPNTNANLSVTSEDTSSASSIINLRCASCGGNTHL